MGYLDSYYLLQEKLYRALYDKVRKTDNAQIDFDMNAHLDEFKIPANTWWACVRSKTELWFYFPLAIVSTGIIVLAVWL